MTKSADAKFLVQQKNQEAFIVIAWAQQKLRHSSIFAHAGLCQYKRKMDRIYNSKFDSQEFPEIGFWES